uniref:G_PROTEIN_RECEP_F1_2 domain-containing protein n=1 Tax=Loa loa TaxID=7209 RepID=A0A1I7VSC2_LOALO
MELTSASVIRNDTSATEITILSTIPGMMKEVPTLEPSCYVIDTEHLTERLWLVTILGSTLSAISIVENAFLFLIFITSKQHRRSYSLMTYVVPMMTMSHVAITASSFLIVFATVERFCITASSHYVEFLQNNRCYIALIAVLIGVFTKGTLILELRPVHDFNCIGTLNEYRLEITALVIHNEYYKLFRFWFRNIVTILFPFFTLIFLNARIVNELRKSFLAEKHNIESTHAKERKARIRAATRTLMLVACTYLLANMLNVIITIWEHTDAKSLFSSFLDFYIFSVDTVSLLTIVACALRLPIYASCQPALRVEMIHCGKAFCKRPRHMNNERHKAPLISRNDTISETLFNV